MKHLLYTLFIAIPFISKAQSPPPSKLISNTDTSINLYRVMDTLSGAKFDIRLLEVRLGREVMDPNPVDQYGRIDEVLRMHTEWIVVDHLTLDKKRIPKNWVILYWRGI